MKTFSKSLYDIIAFGLGGATWSQFVDAYNKKYDKLEVEGFRKVPIQLDYTFSQLIGNISATTLPAYVDPESPGYEKALKEVQGEMGNIPTMKAFYSLNRVQLQRRLALIQRFKDAALDGEMQDALIGMIDESTEGLIQSYINALTHQRHQIVSKGSFVIDSTNNPRGLRGITIDFHVPAKNKDVIMGTSKWWTAANYATEGTASDPIQFLIDKKNYIRNTCHVQIPMHIEMAKETLDALCLHTKVLTRIGYYLNPLASLKSNDTTALQVGRNLSPEQVKNYIETIVGLKIVARDSKAWVDVPNASTHTLEQVMVDNFATNVVSFIPDGNIGEIQSVAISTLGYEPDKVTTFDGGRLTLTQRANPETHSIYIESESAVLCVPTAVNQIFIFTVAD